MLPVLMAGRFHEYVPFAGETVGLVRDILPVADLIRRQVDEATATLQQVTALGAQ
jgi:hypothetical protein